MQINNPVALKIQQTLAPIQNAANKVNTGMNTAMTSAMGGDTYQANGSNASAPVQKVPLYQFFDDYNRPPNPLDLKLARRLSMFGISDSQEFLQAASSPFKRKMISYLGGVFLNSRDRQYLDYQIAAWAGQADLMRTGADLQTARLMQVSGAGDTPTLARYNGLGGLDKGMLYGAMAANALQYGYFMPSFGVVSSAVERSRNLPPVIQW